VPVITLAEMASAFIIFVLSLINLALIAFREADVDTYDPAFRAPGYPVVQVVGTIAGFGMIARLGLLPILGAAGITVGGAVIYFVYGRHRTDTTSALDVILDRREDVQDVTPVESD
jgi:APA family basic amino acid/polyamine antiporter